MWSAKNFQLLRRLLPTVPHRPFHVAVGVHPDYAAFIHASVFINLYVEKCFAGITTEWNKPQIFNYKFAYGGPTVKVGYRIWEMSLSVSQGGSRGKVPQTKSCWWY